MRLPQPPGLDVNLTLCIPRGWYLFLTKMRMLTKMLVMLIIYNKIPTDPYKFRKGIKYTFISNREIIGYMKIMTSRAA